MLCVSEKEHYWPIYEESMGMYVWCFYTLAEDRCVHVDIHRWKSYFVFVWVRYGSPDPLINIVFIYRGLHVMFSWNHVPCPYEKTIYGIFHDFLQKVICVQLIWLHKYSTGWRDDDTVFLCVFVSYSATISFWTLFQLIHSATTITDLAISALFVKDSRNIGFRKVKYVNLWKIIHPRNSPKAFGDLYTENGMPSD